KSHDPLALVAHTGSSSRTSSQYYVTHPFSMFDYDDDYQGDTIQNNSDDLLTSSIILLACAITRNFLNPTNNRLRTSSNTRNQAIIQGDIVNIQKEGIDIYMLVEKEYSLSRGTLTMMLVAKLLVDQDNEMSRELLRKIFMQAERPKR
nr:hypothetical protein [Tanacetum cinerariifolium]